MSDLGAVLDQLEAWYDPAWAEPWDSVGLVLGARSVAVQRVHIAVDPTVEVAREAVGAQLLLTHHPLWLGGTERIEGPKGVAFGVLYDARCALYVAHTNADVADPGVSDALAECLGLLDIRQLMPARPDTTGASPGGLGRVGRLPKALSLRAFTALVAERLPRTVTGVRASGDPRAHVQKVAVSGGACLDLADAAVTAGADVFVTSDAKHHRAQEAPLPVVDVPHWAGEWPWTAAVATRLRQAFPGLEVTVSTLVTDPWTLVAPDRVDTSS